MSAISSGTADQSIPAQSGVDPLVSRMSSRALDPTERMVDAFERANTMTFTVVAELRGPLTYAELEAALRKVEIRHPLLRAGVLRDRRGVVLTGNTAAPIPLVIVRDGECRLHELARKSIEHRPWADAGPRAELTWLVIDDARSALLLTLHHLVSDGSSGMLVMRDLLAFLHTPESPVEPLDSPGQHAFLPEGHGGLTDAGRAIAMLARQMRGPKPRRLRAVEVPAAQRKSQLQTLAWSETESARLLSRARRDGATVHGVVCAALAYAIAEEREGHMQQRITHPVDLRRYLRSRAPESRAIGDRVGYYVSSVDTDHAVDTQRPLAEHARAITAAVRAAKERGEPLLMAPIAGPWVVRFTQRMAPERFCAMAERNLMLSTFAVTNLGPVENLGMRAAWGPVQVDDVWFVAACSVLSALGAAVTSFGGRLRFNLIGSAPLIEPAIFERLASRTRAQVDRYLSG